MSEEMKLVKPSVEYLDSYLGCLRRGVDPIRYRESENQTVSTKSISLTSL